LLDPRTLEMSIIAIIVRISVLDADPGRPSVGERRRLSFNASVPVIMVSDEGRVVSGLVIGGREHFSGTGHELVEWR